MKVVVIKRLVKNYKAANVWEISYHKYFIMFSCILLEMLLPRVE